MNQLFKAFSAENIKLKHSGILTTAILLAIVTPIVGLGLSIYSYFTEKVDLKEPIYVFYSEFDNLGVPFINLFYPIIIIVTASRIAQLEHRNNTWQLMETQPVKRTTLLVAKFLKAYQICFLSIIAFMLGTLLEAVVTYALYPKSEIIHLSLDGLLIIKKTISLSLGTGFLLALIYSLSVRFSNSFISIIIGVGCLLLAPILSNFNLLPKWFPTTLLTNSLKVNSDLGYWLTHNEYLSILATLILIVILNFWYVHKNKKWNTIHFKKLTIQCVIPVCILLTAFIFINKPTTILPNNETVIKGIVPPNEDIQTIYLLDGNINDTLSILSIKEKQFYEKISLDLPLKKYRLAWWDSKGENIVNVIFSNNDIVDIQFSNQENNESFKILGTRIAENSLNVKLGNNIDYIQRLTSNGVETNVETIIYLLKKSFKSDESTLNKFYTSDNYTIRNDYKEVITNELFYKYNLIWKKYKDLVVRTNPTFEYKDKSLQDILEIDFEPNEQLIAQAENVEYFRYKIYEIQSNDTSNDDIITKYQRGISNIKNTTLRTQLAKVILQDKLENVNDLVDLERYEHTILPFVNDSRALNYYTKFIADKKRLTAGNDALAFHAITTSNETKTLADYKGKFVVLDFWASWCGPCLYQADYFEKNAIEYNKRGDVVFISLSIDEKEAAWRKKVKLNDKNVVQLYATNQKELNAFYRLNSIPRFIIIDPEGKIINSTFVFPDDSNFKIMLDQILEKK